MSGPGQVSTAPGGRPRVVVLSLSHRPPERVLTYARDLVDAGVEVHLVVADRRSSERDDIDPAVQVHEVMSKESRHPVRRAERAVLFTVPGRALSLSRRLARRARLGPVDRALEFCERGHQRVAGAIHQRLFLPFYRQVRPLLLARRARGSLRDLDVATADRIVAADISAVPLGWRLARRHPNVPATTSADPSVYRNRAGGTDRGQPPVG